MLDGGHKHKVGIDELEGVAGSIDGADVESSHGVALAYGVAVGSADAAWFTIDDAYRHVAGWLWTEIARLEDVLSRDLLPDAAEDVLEVADG